MHFLVFHDTNIRISCAPLSPCKIKKKLKLNFCWKLKSLVDYREKNSFTLKRPLKPYSLNLFFSRKRTPKIYSQNHRPSYIFRKVHFYSLNFITSRRFLTEKKSSKDLRFRELNVLIIQIKKNLSDRGFFRSMTIQKIFYLFI